MTATDTFANVDPTLIAVAPGVASSPSGRRGWSTARTVLGRLGAAVLSIALILVVWQLFLELLDVDSFVGRGPIDVWNFLTTEPGGADARTVLWNASIETLTDAGVGLLVGTAVALCCAVLFNLSPGAEQTFMPIAVVLRTIPLVAMTPLIVLVFGRGLLGVTVISAIVTFFPVLVNVSLALRSTPPAAIDLCHAYGADARTTLRKVQFPTALPALFASLRIAAPLALIGALLAEWLATGKGLGYLMLQSQTLSEYDMLWAAVALVTIYSVVTYSIIAAIERVMLARYSG